MTEVEEILIGPSPISSDQDRPHETHMISVVIPALNEEKAIGETINEIPTEELLRMGYESEVIVVDGNSKDRTREAAERHNAKVIVEQRKGYGAAYKAGFAVCTGDILITLDGDHSYPASMIPKLVKTMLQKDLDFITTNRLARLEKGSMQAMHKLGNWVLNAFVRILFDVKLDDSQSGMWVIKRDALRNIIPRSNDMSFSEEIKIRASRSCRFVEVPISYRKRIGTRKLQTFVHGFKNLSYLLFLRASLAFGECTEDGKQ